jgi:hypothetical protein
LYRRKRGPQDLTDLAHPPVLNAGGDDCNESKEREHAHRKPSHSCHAAILYFAPGNAVLSYGSLVCRSEVFDADSAPDGSRNGSTGMRS